MSRLSQRLQDVFRRQTKRQARLLQRAEQTRTEAAEELEHWPQLNEHIHEKSLPKLNGLSQWATDEMAPPDLKPLHKAKKRLTRLMLLTWLQPKAAKIRVGNFAYRMGIFTIRLIQLAVVLGIIYLILKVIYYLA